MKKKLIVLILLLFQLSSFAINSNPLEIKHNDTTQVKELFAIAEQYKNNPDSAFKYYFKALEIAQKIKSKNYIALSFKYIGTNYYYKPDFEKALDFWQKSLNEYKFLNDKNGIATVLGNMGIIYEYQSNYQKALNTYQEALNIFEEIGDKDGIARNLGHIGIMYEYQGNYTKALENYQKALRINEEIGKRNSIAGNLTNLGILYKTQNDNDKALEYYNKALRIYEELNDKNKIARNYINIGIIYTIKNDYQKALDFYNKALEINKEIGNKNIIASNLENIGIIYEQQENYSLALNHYQKSLKINQEIGNKRALTTNLINIASVYSKLNEYTKTISLAKEALIITRESGDLDLKKSIYYHLSEAYYSLNNLQKTIEYKDLWIQLNDSIYNIEKSKAIANIQTRYETEKKDQEIESLQKDNEIQKLQLEENKQRTKAQRWLFLFFSVILFSIVLVIWFVYTNYKKQQTINHQKLQYQKVLTEQKMLRSQMNPHFIYNSLNSIQAFISSDQSYEAEKYLARFAKLIRGILENSRENIISLEKEIEVLKLYLSLEQLRFENRFTYDIYVEEAIEQDFTSIPPMLVQPFVENAILHGLKNKTEGKLSIHFLEKDDYLICEIDDNGIGRKASEEDFSKKEHKSLATTITQERLQALSKEFNKPAYFHIDDKINPDTNKSLGTKVTIQIPFIEN